MKIPIPLLPEQQKIASILSGVDALIESTQKVIEKTERLKKGLMQKLLVSGIKHTKFKKVQTHFGKYKKIPEKWESVTIECVADKLLSGGTPSTFISEYWTGNIAWTKGVTLTTHYLTKGEKIDFQNGSSK